MPKSNSWAQAVMKAWSKGVAPIPPANLYIALASASFTAAADGSKELVGNGYTRMPISFPDPDGTNTAKNIADIVFAAATGQWVTATDWGIFDQAVGGTMYYYGTLDVPKTAGNGDQVKVPANSITIGEI